MSWKKGDTTRADIVRLMLDLSDLLRVVQSKIAELEAATHSARRPMSIALSDKIRRHTSELRWSLDSEACRLLPKPPNGKDLALNIFLGVSPMPESDREELFAVLAKDSA